MEISKRKKLNISQIDGIRNSRCIILRTLTVILLVSLWYKIGINSNWHFNEVVPEVISVFVLIVIGILANIKNDLPIFQMRRLELNKEFLYSIILSFTLLFFFIIYKNIVDTNFINYIAELSFHDTCSLVVFLAPFFLLMIYLIYLGFRLFDKNLKKNKRKVYDAIVERRFASYKSLTIKIISLIMFMSLWYKVGFTTTFTLWDVLVEIICLLTVVILFISGNVVNDLPALYNNYIVVNKYLFYSILLPYFLVLVYYLINKQFRGYISLMSFKGLISIVVYMFPLFLAASLLFYKGCFIANKTEKVRKNAKKKNKIIENALISFGLTVISGFLLFLYIYTNILKVYNLENILQGIIVFIPLCVIIYLILYSGIKYINK